MFISLSCVFGSLSDFSSHRVLAEWSLYLPPPGLHRHKKCMHRPSGLDKKSSLDEFWLSFKTREGQALAQSTVSPLMGQEGVKLDFLALFTPTIHRFPHDGSVKGGHQDLLGSLLRDVHLERRRQSPPGKYWVSLPSRQPPSSACRPSQFVGPWWKIIRT